MSFTCFPKLPPELRHKIWEEVCCVKRLIDIHPVLSCSASMSLDLNEEFDEVPIRFRTLCRNAPPLLHVSKEARLIGLKNYQLGLGTFFDQETTDSLARIQITTPPQFYVNWNYDILCPFFESERQIFGIALNESMFRQLERMPISCIAISWIEVDEFAEKVGVDKWDLAGVKEVTVYWEPEDFWIEDYLQLKGPRKPVPLQLQNRSHPQTRTSISATYLAYDYRALF
ncbi:hypothetical protein BDZ45DRAFT_671436 [Acephala macrosclerotiorum]|nr:hypothetical protein BDZ45DRAFT_671436 [Acephala macrosclerotiorum]